MTEKLGPETRAWTELRALQPEIKAGLRVDRLVIRFSVSQRKREEEKEKQTH